MRVIELKVELERVVALTLHPRLTVIDASAPNDVLVEAVRSLVSGEPVKMHAVVFEGDRYHLRDADELRALGWTSDAVMLDVEDLHGDDDSAEVAIDEGREGPVAELAAQVTSARRLAESADRAARRTADALALADAQTEGVIATLRTHEAALDELKRDQREVEHRLSELSKRQAIMAGHLDTLAKLRSDPPATAVEIVVAVEALDALPPESVDEIRTALADWNRPILSTYDLLMGSHQAPASLEEQFGLERALAAEGHLALVEAEPDADPAALPDAVLQHLDKAELTLTAQSERIKEISATIRGSMDEQAKKVVGRQRLLTAARAAMLARTGARETLRHQHERALEAAGAAREQLADLAVAGRLVRHIARMPTDPVAGRPALVIEHRSEDEAHREQLLRALPVISGGTQVVVVTSDASVLDWARRLSSVDGALRSASAL